MDEQIETKKILVTRDYVAFCFVGLTLILSAFTYYNYDNFKNTCGGDFSCFPFFHLLAFLILYLFYFVAAFTFKNTIIRRLALLTGLLPLVIWTAFALINILTQ